MLVTLPGKNLHEWVDENKSFEWETYTDTEICTCHQFARVSNITCLSWLMKISYFCKVFEWESCSFYMRMTLPGRKACMNENKQSEWQTYTATEICTCHEFVSVNDITYLSWLMKISCFCKTHTEVCCREYATRKYLFEWVGRDQLYEWETYTLLPFLGNTCLSGG